MTQKDIKKILHYNPETGELIWNSRPLEMFKSKRIFKSWNARFANKQAGYVIKHDDGKSYRTVTINYKHYYAHRAIWFYMTGKWPNQIDHINGQGADNRWENLRNVDASINSQNVRQRSNNTSGITGISFDKATGRWMVRICINRKQINLGRFSNFNKAISIRKHAEKKYGFHENHGSVRPL